MVELCFSYPFLFGLRFFIFSFETNYKQEHSSKNKTNKLSLCILKFWISYFFHSIYIMRKN